MRTAENEDFVIYAFRLIRLPVARLGGGDGARFGGFALWGGGLRAGRDVCGGGA